MVSAAAITLHWWAQSGVDVIVGETPRDWLNPAASPALAPALADLPTEEAPSAPLPAYLAAFQGWLLESDEVPGAAPSAPRLGPQGRQGATLMVLTDIPAAADFEAGKLVSSDGLFDRMLGAIGLSREDIYLASLSPLRPVSGSLDEKAISRLSEIARHHVALVRPETLLLLGDGCARALTGANVAQGRSRWHEIETPAGPVKAIVTLKPEQLLLQPNLKKLAWADLQMLREGTTE